MKFDLIFNKIQLYNTIVARIFLRGGAKLFVCMGYKYMYSYFAYVRELKAFKEFIYVHMIYLKKTIIIKYNL